MENRSHALMTGIFTIALVIAAVLVGIWLNRDRNEVVPFEIVTTQSIPGLNPQATVRYRGLEVGRVDDIMFDPRVTGQILIKLSVDTSTPVTNTTFASLGYQGVTGLAFLQLDDDRTGSARLKAGSRIPMRPGLLDQIEKRGLAILERTEKITANLDRLVSPDNQQVIIGAFDNIGKAAAAYGELPKKLGPTIDRLPAMAAKIDRAADSVDAVATNANKVFVKLQAPDGPLDRINSAVGSLQGVATTAEMKTLPQLTAAADEATTTLRSVRRAANALTDRPQSILFGGPNAQPGPGEPGFVPPAK